MKQNTTIDELKAKIQSLEKEKKQYLSLFDSGEVSLFKWVNNEEWTTVYASQNVYRLFGYTQEEFLNKEIDYSDIIHKDDFDTVYNEVIHALDNNIEYFTHTEYRIITKTNEVKWVLDNTYMIHEDDGKVSHFLGTISDITRLKEYELNLEHIVETKTAENLLQKDILHTQSRFLTIGQTIQNIAHQWRQPLNHIGVNLTKLEMMNATTLHNDEIQTIIENSNNSLEYMSKTISDFSSFFSPNKEKANFYLKEPIEEAIRIIKPQLESSNIELHNDINNNSFKINGHKNELTQVILILINNAQDAIFIKKDKSNFHSIIKISLHSDNNNVILCVEDNGGGIKEEILSKIFEPYFTTKFKLQGTGIGLYMSKMIIEKDMHGVINARNTKDGAIFSISLPII